MDQNGNFLSSRAPLGLGNAAAALLVTEDRRYVVQRRDDIAPIWYPGHWGLFGGSIDAGEDETEALRRELREELEFEMQSAHLFTRFEFDLKPIGLDRYTRCYYEVPIEASAIGRLVLHEGTDLQVLPGDQALMLNPLCPYDGFALFLHHHRCRLG